MNKLLSLFAVAVTTATCSGCANVPEFSPQQASLALQTGMTEAEAIDAVNRQPTSAEESTCGTGYGSEKAWSCRILHFEGDIHGLVIYESQWNGTWRVNNWYVY